MTEEQEKWYERETAAFRAWWEAYGEKTYSETPTMAAGAGWLKRAESSAQGVYATNDKRKFEALDLSASSEKTAIDQLHAYRFSGHDAPAAAARLTQVGFTNGTNDVIWHRDCDPEHLLPGAILFVHADQVK